MTKKSIYEIENFHAAIKKTKFVVWNIIIILKDVKPQTRKRTNKGIKNLFLYTGPSKSYLVVKCRKGTAFENFKRIQTRPFREC